MLKTFQVSLESSAQFVQRAFSLMATYELSLNVGITLQVEVNSYMKENKVMNGLLVSVDEK
jgi:hypothetical protein